MTIPTELTVVNGIEIPKEALLNAYRKDIRETSDLGLLAFQLNLTINLYEFSNDSFSNLNAPLNQDQKISLDVSERAALSQPKSTLGKGFRTVDLLYNKLTERYEILEKQENNFVRVGNSGDKENSLYHCMVKTMQPSVKDNKRAVTSYKKQLANIKDISDSNMRVKIKVG